MRKSYFLFLYFSFALNVMAGDYSDGEDEALKLYHSTLYQRDSAISLKDFENTRENFQKVAGLMVRNKDERKGTQRSLYAQALYSQGDCAEQIAIIFADEKSWPEASLELSGASCLYAQALVIDKEFELAKSSLIHLQFHIYSIKTLANKSVEKDSVDFAEVKMFFESCEKILSKSLLSIDYIEKCKKQFLHQFPQDNKGINERLNDFEKFVKEQLNLPKKTI